ncbi:MAG: DNA polymerase III subunit chi [Magnetococcales bacterium]|nr:DNA polymerase III subunit chi [Magnetococcales bacterium]
MRLKEEEPPLVRFYQPASNAMGPAAVQLLNKAYEQQMRVLLLASGVAQAHEWDGFLWRYPEEGFLPHAVWSAPYPDRQPVLIALEPLDVNRASILINLGLEPLDRLDQYDMVIHFVDGSSPAQLTSSRKLFRHYLEADCILEHWVQSPSGQWKKNA